MASGDKKRKVDRENRTFKDKWRLSFFSTDNSRSNTPVCVICRRTQSAFKKMLFGDIMIQLMHNGQIITQSVPLSNDTTTRRTEKIAEDLRKTLVQKLRNAENISICMDELTDITDIAQFSVFVQFLDHDSQQFCEELLALLPMLDTTTGS